MMVMMMMAIPRIQSPALIIDHEDSDGDGSDDGTGLPITRFSAPISFVLHSHGEDHNEE